MLLMSENMVLALVRAVRDRGAHPLYSYKMEGLTGSTRRQDVQFETSLNWELERMKGMDAYIALRGSSNVFETSDLSLQMFSVP